MKVAHLLRRFLGSLSDRPPAAADVVWAEGFFNGPEQAMWRRMSNPDRRHTITVARRFVSLAPDAPAAAVAGALLHDIGKLDSGLGTYRRVMATIVGPRTAAFRRYHDHEAIGAEWIAAIGSSPITVELVRGEGPWAAALRAADHV